MGKKLLTAEQLAKELRGGVDTVVAFEQTKKEKIKLQSQQVRCSRDRTIQAALIQFVALILVPFISCLLSSHKNNKSAPIQINVTISSDAETKGNLSPAVVNSPNSTVNYNTYLTPRQSETGSEVNEMDVNRSK